MRQVHLGKQEKGRQKLEERDITESLGEFRHLADMSVRKC